MKYVREGVVAGALGEELGDAIARGMALGWQVAAIVPVTLARRRACARGFDQADLLARAASRRCGVPPRALLRRIRETPTQVGLGRGERAANVGAFTAAPIVGGVVLVVVDATTRRDAVRVRAGVAASRRPRGARGRRGGRAVSAAEKRGAVGAARETAATGVKRPAAEGDAR